MYDRGGRGRIMDVVAVAGDIDDREIRRRAAVTICQAGLGRLFGRLGRVSKD